MYISADVRSSPRYAGRVSAETDEPDEPELDAVQKRNGRIQSVDRAAALMRAIASMPPESTTLQALADRCGLKRSTTWRILMTLEHNGLVDRRGSRYTMGFAAAQLATASAVDGVVRLAHPVISRIAVLSGETSTLAVARRLGLYYVDQAVSTRIVSENWLGRQVPLHATSSGKAFLAWLSGDEVDEALPKHLPRFTGTTVTDPAELRGDLAETRVRGYAICAGELESDSFGVAAPVLDPAGRPVAVVSIWGPPDRVPVTRFAALGELCAQAATDLVRLLELA
jgi:DNA-binding IclR family transcriptional regulator